MLVCPGAIGSTAIELLLGAPGLVRELVRSSQDSRIAKKLTMRVIDNEMQTIRSLTDWKGYGGAPMLGFEHPIITTASDGNADIFTNAIKLAAKSVREDIIRAIRQHFSR